MIYSIVIITEEEGVVMLYGVMVSVTHSIEHNSLFGKKAGLRSSFNKTLYVEGNIILYDRDMSDIMYILTIMILY